MRIRGIVIFAALWLPPILSRAEDGGGMCPQPVWRSDQFVDFIGLAAAPFEEYLESGPFKGAGTKYPPEYLFELGVRHYRMGLKNDLTLKDAPAKVRAAYEKYGARPMLLIDPGKDGTPENVVKLVKEYGGAEIVGEVEGPNEVNNKFPPQELNLKYAGKHDEAAGAAYMKDYYFALKADPETRGIPVVNYTAIFTDYRLAKPCDAFDYNNMHSYQGYDVPSASLLPNFVRSNHMLPVGGRIKPFVVTECGYNVEEDKSNHFTGNGNLMAQALNIPMLLGEYFRHGYIRRAYLFSLTNADGYGLLESDQSTKRPSYYALQSLIAELKDAEWNPRDRRWEGGLFTPAALPFSIADAPRTLKCFTLQKSNGDYFLLLWNELRNWDSELGKGIDNAEVPITVKFGAAMDRVCDVIKQDKHGGFGAVTEVALENGKLALKVPSSLILVKVRRKSPLVQEKLEPPYGLRCETSETSVSLSWAPPKKARWRGCYFVYRNNGYIGGTTEKFFKDSSEWVRPGMGYLYEVQACDTEGHLSERTVIVADTQAKFPDLVVTDFGMENREAKPGSAVRFRARIKNIGSGSTPSGVSISASFFVDNELISWGGVGPLAPGEERECIASGGPKATAVWTAKHGIHILKVQLDDLDRIPDEQNKTNNVCDRTLCIEEPMAGEITGASEAAPWKVDLSAEGKEDWIHWGQPGNGGETRKAGANKIGPLAKLGQGFMGATGGFAVRSTWSNGTPLSVMKATNAGLWVNGVGSGFTFTVPAGRTERTLKIYAGGIEGAGCSLAAELSDHSATPYIDKTWTGNSGQGYWAPVPGAFAVVYTLKFHAASEGQTLKVEYRLDAEANRLLGQAHLGAAALSVSP